MSLCLRLVSGRAAPLLARRSLAPSSACLATTPCTSAIQKYSAQEWEAKNEKMGRPLSPHLTIYKPQLTSMMSITHRFTGVGMHFGLMGFAGAMLYLPNSFPYYLELVSKMSYGPAMILIAKMLVAWPLCYHYMNGMRHLSWDLGKGFEIKTLYHSGYVVIALSVSLALGAALFL